MLDLAEVPHYWPHLADPELRPFGNVDPHNLTGVQALLLVLEN